MSGILPLVRGTATALFPLTRIVSFDTAVNIAINGTEQRYKRRQVLGQATLNYRQVTSTDRDGLKTFFNSQKGAFDSTWSLVLGKSAIGTLVGTTLTIPTSGAYFFSSSDAGQDVYIGLGTPIISKIVSITNSHTAVIADSGSASNVDTRWGVYMGGMALLDDTFFLQETVATLYDVTLRCRQTQNRGDVKPSAGSTYPSFAANYYAQHPYVQIRRFYTIVNDMASGPRYAYEYYGEGLTGFPTGALLGWQLSYPNMSNADLQTLENFFRGQWGRYGSFTFIDPEGFSGITNCRFDMDALSIQHTSYNQNSVTVRIAQTNG